MAATACGKSSPAEAPDAGEYFPNPVKDSEADSTLTGTDADGNGVRDDLDRYIASLESDPDRRVALTSFARESTRMMLLGGEPAATKDAAYSEQVRIVLTTDCLAYYYEPAQRRTMVTDLGNALYNNAARLRAYHAADALLSGSILPAPGETCDPAVLEASQSPARADLPPVSCGQRTVLYYGNGVNNTAIDADKVARDDLPILAVEADLKGRVRFNVAYNQTNGLFNDVIQTLEQKAQEDHRFTWFAMNNVVAYLIRGINSPTRFLNGVPGGDAFVAQLQDIINTAIANSDKVSTPLSDDDLSRHVAAYRSDIVDGNRVIVVAHSQGNLYANAARSRLSLLEPEAAGYFGVVAVATPAETAPDGYVTSSSDLVIGLLRRLGQTVLPANINVSLLAGDFLGHGFEETYINAALPTRRAVVSLLSSIGTRLPYRNEPCPLEIIPGPTISVSVGWGHACIVLLDGNVECWGVDAFTGLGNNNPVRGLSGPAVSVSAGQVHTCVLLSGGTVQCWGFNRFGVLGDGTQTTSITPVTVVGLHDVVAISSGSTHVCAVRAGGTIECWGSNRRGALGIGSLQPTQSGLPLQVSGIATATAVSVAQVAGTAHSCALVEGGAVLCWGDNIYGQLGDGSRNMSALPVPVTGIAGATAVSASGVGYDGSCAIVPDGAVKCWGANHYGQLGNNSTVFFSLMPVSVFGLSGATGLAGGASFNCALADGKVSCWGVNSQGQLGNGANLISRVPVLVGGDGIGNATEVAAGFGYACAILATGDTRCWGHQ